GRLIARRLGLSGPSRTHCRNATGSISFSRWRSGGNDAQMRKRRGFCRTISPLPVVSRFFETDEISEPFLAFSTSLARDQMARRPAWNLTLYHMEAIGLL